MQVDGDQRAGWIDRPLSPQELAIVRRMLQEDFPGVEHFREQLPELYVIIDRPADSADLTVYFGLRSEPEGLPALPDGLLVDAEVKTGADEYAYLLLFARGEQLSCLEVYCDHGEIFELPDADSLEILWHPP